MLSKDGTGYSNEDIARFNVIASLIADEPSIALADIGCGPHPLLAGEFMKKGHIVVATDRFRREQWPRYPGINLGVQDIRELTYKDLTFDAALALEVLEHLADDEEAALAVEQLKRIAARVIVTVPNNEQRPLYREDESCGHHVSFDTGKLQTLLPGAVVCPIVDDRWLLADWRR